MARKPAAPLDPLEAAKTAPLPSVLDDLTMPQEPSDGSGLPPSTPAPENASRGNVAPSSAARGEPDLAPPAPGGLAARYTVERKITIWWGHQMLVLTPGDVISEASYGPGSIERMREAGVALREVAD